MSKISSHPALVPVLGFLALGLFLLNFGVYLSRASAPVRILEARGCGAHHQHGHVHFERQAERGHYALRIHQRRCERNRHAHRVEIDRESSRVVIVR